MEAEKAESRNASTICMMLSIHEFLKELCFMDLINLGRTRRDFRAKIGVDLSLNGINERLVNIEGGRELHEIADFVISKLGAPSGNNSGNNTKNINSGDANSKMARQISSKCLISICKILPGATIKEVLDALELAVMGYFKQGNKHIVMRFARAISDIITLTAHTPKPDPSSTRWPAIDKLSELFMIESMRIMVLKGMCMCTVCEDGKLFLCKTPIFGPEKKSALCEKCYNPHEIDYFEYASDPPIVDRELSCKLQFRYVRHSWVTKKDTVNCRWQKAIDNGYVLIHEAWCSQGK